MHPVDAIRSRLRRAGCSLAEWCAVTLFVVELSLDRQLAQARGQGPTQAWHRAQRLVEGLWYVFELLESPPPRPKP